MTASAIVMDPAEQLPEPAAPTYTPSEALRAHEQNLVSEALSRRRRNATVPQIIGDTPRSAAKDELDRLLAGIETLRAALQAMPPLDRARFRSGASSEVWAAVTELTALPESRGSHDES